MKNFTNKYIEIHDKVANSITIMFVQEQKNLDSTSEILFTGVGCMYDGKNFQATATMLNCAIIGDCIVEEITRQRFLELRNAMWSTFLVYLTRKTYRLEKCKK